MLHMHVHSSWVLAHADCDIQINLVNGQPELGNEPWYDYKVGFLSVAPPPRH